MSRTWKWIVCAGVVVVAAGTVGLLHGVLRRAERVGDVRAEIERIRAEGGPVCAADLIGKPIPTNENAATIYELAFKPLATATAEKDRDVVFRFIDADERAKDPKLWSQARTIVARYEKALALADKAAAMPKCRFHVEWGRPFEYECPHHAHLQFLAILFWARALVEAKGGETDSALKSVESAFAVSEALEREPAIIAVLARWVIIEIASGALDDVCQVGTINEAQARRLSDTIGSISLSGSAAKSLQGERALGILSFDEIRHGRYPRISDNEKSADAVERLYKKPSFQPVLNLDEVVYLREMRKAIGDASLPYRLLCPHVRNGDEPDLPKYALFSAILLPLVPGPEIRVQDRVIAHLAGSQLLLGLLAYHDHYGVYPASLGDLKKLDWLLPKDPFSGKPFIYRRKGSGFLLYSISYDLKDNGGIERNGDKPGDIVWKRER